MRIHLALALALLALSSPTWAADWDGWFHVSWEPEPEGKTPTPRIQGLVRNDSPYRVTDVQLEVEGLSADKRSVGASCGRSGTSNRVDSRHSSSRRCPGPLPIGSASARSMSCRPTRRTDPGPARPALESMRRSA